MLPQAASRRISSHILQRRIRPSLIDPAPFLPFLYPSFIRDPKFLRHTSSSSARQLLVSCSLSNDRRPIKRSFATAQADAITPDPPWQDLVPSQSSLRSELVFVDVPDAPQSLNLNNGVSKEADDLLSMFYACLETGYLPRAQILLLQVMQRLDKDSNILVGANNSLLHALLERANADSNNLDSIKAVFLWYDARMQGAFGDAITFSVLLKASMFLSSREREQYVLQYVKKWKDHGAPISEVLDQEILADQDVVSIAKICNLAIKELHMSKRKNIDGILAKDYSHTKHAPKITEVPEVLPTKQKGSGLESIRDSLRSLIDPDCMPSRQNYGQSDMEFQIERQKLLEEDAYDSALRRWESDFDSLSKLGLLSLPDTVNQLLWQWHQEMVPLIKEEVKKCKKIVANPLNIAGETDRKLYGPYLQLMEPDKVAAMVIIETIRMLSARTSGAPTMEDGIKASYAVMNLAHTLEKEHLAQEMSKKQKQKEGLFPKMNKEDLKDVYSDRIRFKKLVKEARAKANAKQEEALKSAGGAQAVIALDSLTAWPEVMKAKLGAILLSMLLFIAKVPVTAVRNGTGEKVTQPHPAIFHSYSFVVGRRLGMIKRHPKLAEYLGSKPLRRGLSIGRLLPMLVPPRPWMSYDDGGYYYTRNHVVRTKQSQEQLMYVKAASASGGLEPLFQGLDVLGETAWRVNKRVFDVVIQVWNSGEALADIPEMMGDLDLPPEPVTEDYKERIEWKKKIAELKKDHMSKHSQRCDMNFKVEIARALLFEKFYYPHNVDFRGRAYPIPPNLNHLGNDLSRGLLIFDEAREIGASGLRWLKIHLSNLTGYDKASFSDRVKHAEDHMEDILDSATSPLTGKRWWLQAEDPWQALAACFALQEAYELPDPTKYKSRLYVSQDGTCNGLQHYAALGGDEMGAKQVNLEPSDRPQDVYTGVAELVKEKIEKDVATGHLEATLAQGFITRKVVKQTVMTNVYGVTFIGARLQIVNRLKEIPEFAEGDRAKHLSKISVYLTKLVFSSLETMFNGANRIQTWLTTAAKRISRAISPLQIQKLQESSVQSVNFMTSVIWTTPMGLPVVQPYRKDSFQLVQTNLQKVHLQDPYSIEQVHARRQMTAFPPNFVHSLDASHMLLSAIKCAENGIQFAAVHDSFWTHPSDIDKMNRILRDAFVQLHSKDKEGRNVMDRLLDEFQTRYRGYMYQKKVQVNVALAKQIALVRRKGTNVTYRGGIDGELLYEAQRLKLLASEDAGEREKGKTMITPVALVERGGIAEEVLEPEESVGLGIINAAKLKKSKSKSDMIDELAEEKSDGTRSTQSKLDPHSDDSETYATEEPQMVKPERTEGIAGPSCPEEQTPATGCIEGRSHLEKSIEEVAEATEAIEAKVELTVWLPLDFPPLPDKGKFDIEKLKKSDYFFS